MLARGASGCSPWLAEASALGLSCSRTSRHKGMVAEGYSPHGNTEAQRARSQGQDRVFKAVSQDSLPLPRDHSAGTHH